MNPSTKERSSEASGESIAHGEQPILQSGSFHRIESVLGRGVNAASLGIFRICLGLAMCFEAWSLVRPKGSMPGGATPLEAYFTGADVTFNIPYPIAGWLPLFPPAIIQALVAILAVTGLTFAAGFCYRASAVILCLTWGYFFAAESAFSYWHTHYYAELLLLFLMVWMPAANRFSVDSWLTKLPSTAPFWTVLLLRGQLLIAYFYGGVSKINSDWLLDAVPMRWMLAMPEATKPFEPYLSSGQLTGLKSLFQNANFAYFISYGAVVFPVTIGFLLLARRTRYFGLVCLFLFHAAKAFLGFSDLGAAPLFGIITALIFLEPDWPERLWLWLRKPHFTSPDWSWFTIGAVAVPVVGGLLGWKARPGKATAQQYTLRRYLPIFVLGWLGWQAVMPLRHWLISGDARFTFEGQSFSWKSNVESRRASLPQLQIHDPGIVVTNKGGSQINWANWKGEKILYRILEPGVKPVPWWGLPEFVILMEPILGERIIYNPLAEGVKDETVARQRVAAVWKETFNREPEFVGRTRPLNSVLQSIAETLGRSGLGSEAALVSGLAARALDLDAVLSQTNSTEGVRLRAEIRSTLQKLHSRDVSGSITPMLRPLDPFILEGEPRRQSPFMVIEDFPLFEATRPQRYRVDCGSWKMPGEIFEGDEIMTVCIASPGAEARELLPQACVFQPELPNPPYIWWNCAKDLSAARYEMAGYQPFYLRKYARRVAGIWERDHGRRPAITAFTSVSLNGRRAQTLVNPDVDLAGVSVNWLRHDEWINDLQAPRIPRESLDRGVDFGQRAKP